MAITAPLLKVTLRYVWAGQKCQQTSYFKTTGAAFLTASTVGVGEAYWNHVKAAWRAFPLTTSGSVFQSVLVEEVGGGFGFGEFPIPPAEAVGVRAAGSLGDSLPPFLAAGIRYTVGTRTTRPGQMRIPFLFDGDTDSAYLASGFKTLCNTLGALYAADMVLGAPVATGVLRKQVVRFTATVPPTVATQQDVVGYLTNTVVTSQVSRKLGRGA